jgi:predicted metal-binding protein
MARLAVVRQRCRQRDDDACVQLCADLRVESGTCLLHCCNAASVALSAQQDPTYLDVELAELGHA